MFSPTVLCSLGSKKEENSGQAEDELSETNHLSLLKQYDVCKFTALLKLENWLFDENTGHKCLIHLPILHRPFDFLTAGEHKFCDTVFMLFLFVIIHDSSSLWLVKQVIFNPLLGLPKGIISYLLTLHMISQSLLSYPIEIPCVYFLPPTWFQLLFLFFNKSANSDNLQPLSFFQIVCMNPLNRISHSNKSFRAPVVIFSFAVDCSGTQFYGKI